MTPTGLSDADIANLNATIETLPLRWALEMSAADGVASGEPSCRFARLEPVAEGLGLLAYGIDRTGPAVIVGTLGRDGEPAESDWAASFRGVPEAVAGIAAHINAQLAAWGLQVIPTNHRAA